MNQEYCIFFLLIQLKSFSGFLSQIPVGAQLVLHQKRSQKQKLQFVWQ